MFIVVEGDVFIIVGINAGGGDNRSSEVAADVFYNGISVAEIGLGIDIETVFVLFVNVSFYFFKRRTDAFFQFIEESSLESFTKIGVMKVLNNSPEAVFGKETMDMRVPFERSAESMEDTDEAGDKVSAFVEFMEQSENDAADSLKKTVKEGAVLEKEREQIFINGKNKVSVCTINEFKGLFSRAVNTVLITAGRKKI